MNTYITSIAKPFGASAGEFAATGDFAEIKHVTADNDDELFILGWD
mgnify:CR=1 FL=1